MNHVQENDTCFWIMAINGIIKKPLGTINQKMFVFIVKVLSLHLVFRFVIDLCYKGIKSVFKIQFDFI